MIIILSIIVLHGGWACYLSISKPSIDGMEKFLYADSMCIKLLDELFDTFIIALFLSVYIAIYIYNY